MGALFNLSLFQSLDERLDRIEDKAYAKILKSTQNNKYVNSESLSRQWDKIIVACGFNYDVGYEMQYSSEDVDLSKWNIADNLIVRLVHALVWYTAIYLLHAERMWLVHSWHDSSIAHQPTRTQYCWQETAILARKYAQIGLHFAARLDAKEPCNILQTIIERAKKVEAVTEADLKASGKEIFYDSSTTSGGTILGGYTIALIESRFKGEDYLRFIETLDENGYLTSGLK